MVGFTAPNRYEPRAGWRLTLVGWVQEPPGAGASWQHQIGDYWRWRTVDGMSLSEAWEELSMTPERARAALDPASPDSGLVPPELFSRALARSRAAGIDPDDDVDAVVIAPTPAAELPDRPEVGFTPATVDPPRPALYQPRARWRARLVPAPAMNVAWQADLHLYWRRRTEGGMSPRAAWADVRMHPTNARTSLDRNLADRGSIPPEIIGRVVARSQAERIDPDDSVQGIVLYPELTA